MKWWKRKRRWVAQHGDIEKLLGSVSGGATVYGTDTTHENIDWSKLHVLEATNSVQHETSEDCVCGPNTRFVEGGSVIVHHSLDGRENDE